MLRSITAAAFCLLLVCSNALGFEVREVQSKAGLKAWLVEDHANALIAFNFAFDRGAATDADGKEGTANLLSSLLDEGAGTMTGEAFQAQRDDLSIRMSFRASQSRFVGSLQTLSRNRAAAFDLLRLALTSPTFPPEAIERMRKQAIVSAQSAEQNPQRIAYRALAQMALGTHAFSRSTSGTTASLGLVTRDDVIASKAAIFATDNLKISAVGDINAEDLSAIIDAVFASLPQKSAIQKPTVPVIASGPGLRIIERDMPQSLIFFGAPGIGYADPDYIPAYVMTEILGGGMTSAWLNQDVREKGGLTYSINFGLSPFETAGLCLGSFSTKNESAGHAMNLVKAALRRMAAHGPTQQELNNAKTYLTGSRALNYDTDEKIADSLLSQQIAGHGTDFYEKLAKDIDAVTLEDVQKQARRLLDPDKLLVVAVGKPAGLQ